VLLSAAAAASCRPCKLGGNESLDGFFPNLGISPHRLQAGRKGQYSKKQEAL
jgi:hypothetical protein